MLIFQVGAVVVIAILINLTAAKVYRKCELAKELSEVHGIPREDVGTYVCIAERQSNFNTQAIGEGIYYGMYQMSSEFWCDKFARGKACNLNCNSLINDDISDDLQCMRTIIDDHRRYSGNGFSAWPSGLQCQSMGSSYISDCSIESNQVHSTYNSKSHNKAPPQQKKTPSGNVGKVYERCELARELRFKHSIPMDHIATWVCIAKHESNFNTSAIGRLNWDGSEDHGLFQISDLYWCDKASSGKGCGLHCDDLEDSDIANDVECIKAIHAEHTRLFGDGFQAWAVYPRCKGQSESYINGCFDDSDNEVIPFKQQPGIRQPTIKPKISHHRSSSTETGKVYDRCELALELRDKHQMPINQIATWVCIAKHESNFNTSAIGRLNWDGSEDHGLFQISDLYWCGKGTDGKGCGLHCDDLEDSDITNDVECIKTIHAEHTRLFGDGFQAWAVYPRCKGQSENYIKGCFDDSSNEVLPFTPRPGVHQPKVTYTKTFSQRKQYNKVPGKGKVYERCELAQELRFKHKIAMEQVATWVCIAKHESNFNTSAIGRLNWDGSEDHGLFQISDIYWCTTTGQGKGCNIDCASLEDSDITDDVKCMLKIHDEHTYLSGDGFTAWAVYKPHCQGRAESYIDGCFNDDDNFISNARPAVTQPTKPLTTSTKTSTQRPKTTTTAKTTQRVKSYETTTTVDDEPPTTTEKYAETTVYDTTTITLLPIKQLSTTTTTQRNTQKTPNNDLTIQQRDVFNKPNTNKPNSIATKNYYSSTTIKTTGKFNEQKTTTKVVPTTTTTTTKKTTTTKPYRAPSPTSSILKSSTTYKPLTKSTTPFKTTTTKTTTRKPITAQKSVTPFDVFSFYLKGFSSKPPAAEYKPIQFGEKSTVIFKKADTSTTTSAQLKSSTASFFSQKQQQHKPSNVINDDSHKRDVNLRTTTKAPSVLNLNLISSHHGRSDNVKGLTRSGNITPHSFDYLLKLTTPRAFYG